MSRPFERLFQHLAWADQEVLAALEQAGESLPEAYRLLSHLLAAEHIWLCRIQSRDIGSIQVWSTLSAPECRELSARTLEGYQQVLASLSGDPFLGQVTYRDTKGVEYQSPLGDILLHVALHGAYHRGQIAALLRRGGHEPKGTDFILFSRRHPLEP